MRTLLKFLGLVVVLIFFAVSSATGAPAKGEKRLAFVIGNGAYHTGKLVTAANDAGLIAQTLQAAGFDVVGARDVDQESLRGAFRDFLGKVSTAGRHAVVFVYLAGHGVQYEGENYFLPVDARIANPNDIPLQAMRLSDVTKSLSGLPTKVNIVVLDAARPNPFPHSNRQLAGGLALVDPDPNMLIAFNAAPGTVAPEGKGPYGAYAQALAEMIREGGLSLQDVFDRTRLRVNEVTKGAEVPWDASKISAPFVFFNRASNAPAPKVSAAETRAMRTRPIRDFSAHDAYVAALDRDTMRGYEDFLDAYPHDAMAKRVRAIIAARREAITWGETWLRDTPEAYWSYLRRYPHGPHARDARRRLEHFDAELEPPEEFTVYDYDLPPPPPEEIIYVDRPVLHFDDPDFDFEPPPPIDVTFLPPPPPDFVVLEPPPPPVDVFILPTPVFVPIPVFINPPRHIVPPPNDIIFNNIHNTTVINNINTTIRNETINQTAQPSGNAQAGVTTGQKTLGGAVGARADALAAKVALPPVLQKKAAVSRRAPSEQPQVGLPPKPGQRVIQGQQPGAATAQPETESATGKLSRDHALPGADGKKLPLVNGKPALNDQNLPGNKLRKQLGKQGIAGGNQEATGNAGAAVTGEQGTDQRKGKKFRKLPTVNGAPAENGQSAQEKVEKNNPAVSNQNAPSGNQKKLRRNQVQSSGQATVTGPSGQGAVSPNANVRNRSLRKPPNAGGGSAGGEANVQQNFKANKPNENARRQFKQEKQVLSPQRPEFQAQPKPRPRMQERRLQQQPRPQPQVQERRLPQEQPRPQMQERRPPREQPRPQMQERRPPQEQARPQMQERRPPQEQPRPQMQERRPPQEQRRPQIQERRPPQEQPRPQMQERRPSQTQPKPQQQEKKKPSCGQPGEPACGK